MSKHGRIEDATTIKVSKATRDIALKAAEEQGIPLHLYIQNLVFSEMPTSKLIEKMGKNTKIICTDCCLYEAEHKVTEIMKDKKIRIKYLCHHCEMLEDGQ